MHRFLDVHAHRASWFFWSSHALLWPWPWISCGPYCVQGIDGNITNLCLWTTHEGKMCLTHDLWSCDFDLENLCLRNWWQYGQLVTCGLPIRRQCAQAWNFGPVTFDLGAMTLTFRFLWPLKTCDVFLQLSVAYCYYHYYMPIGRIMSVRSSVRRHIGFRATTQKVLQPSTSYVVYRFPLGPWGTLLILWSWPQLPRSQRSRRSNLVSSA